MEALGLLFVGTTLLLLVTQAVESLNARLPLKRSPASGPRLRALRVIGRTQPAVAGVE
jgi:hypothetical protein